jgi:PAS domain S-box-containing protein
VHVQATGAIVAANAEAQRILGQTYDALTQRLTSDFDSETVREDGTHCPVENYPVSRALATGKAQPPMTIGVRRPDGTTSWAVYTAVPVLDPATGKVSGAVVTLLDVTDRKRFERALVESEARLRSVLESAPNMIISADREGRILFINRPVPPRTSEEVVGKSIYDFVRPDDVARVRACVEGVLATGRIDAYEIHSGIEETTWYSVHVGPIRYGDEIAGVTMVTWDITERRALEARLAMADRLASIGTLVAGVAHEINNALMYLLGNLDFMRRRITGSPDAGPLHPGAMPVPVSATSTTSMPASSTFVLTDLIGRVFDPFVTTKPPGVGTGLGLHICRSIVTGMGGDISVTSRVGVGTSFVVRLPLNAGALAPVPSDQARRSVAGCRILVVDDEVSIANIVRDMLEGHDVEIALSGREAISRLREADYDVILCDLIMPEVTGIDVYESLRSRGRGEERRIVFMTGGAFTDGARRFLDVVPTGGSRSRSTARRWNALSRLARHGECKEGAERPP